MSDPAAPAAAPALDAAALYPAQAGVSGQAADDASKAAAPLADPTAPAAPADPTAAAPAVDGEGKPFLADPAAAPAGKEGDPVGDAPAIDYSSLKLEDGFEAPAEVMSKFTDLAQKGKLTPELAQDILNLQTEFQKTSNEESRNLIVAQDREWAAELAKDPDFSGANEVVVKTAIARAVEEFGDPSLYQTLEAYGLSNNPSLVRFIGKMAQALGEGRPTAPGAPRPGGGAEATSAPLAQRLYPSHYPPSP